jgi:hypothetical protein
MQLTIYHKENDKWLVVQIKTQAYGDRKSVSQVILTVLDQYFTARDGVSSTPATPRKRNKPGPKPGSKRKKRGS